MSDRTRGDWVITRDSETSLDISVTSEGIRSCICRMHRGWLAEEHGGSIKGNAEAIMRAIKNHDDLLTTAKQIVFAYEKNGDDGIDWEDLDEAYRMAKCAIKNVEDS